MFNYPLYSSSARRLPLSRPPGINPWARTFQGPQETLRQRLSVEDSALSRFLAQRQAQEHQGRRMGSVIPAGTSGHDANSPAPAMTSLTSTGVPHRNAGTQTHHDCPVCGLQQGPSDSKGTDDDSLASLFGRVYECRGSGDAYQGGNDPPLARAVWPDKGSPSEDGWHGDSLVSGPGLLDNLARAIAIPPCCYCQGVHVRTQVVGGVAVGPADWFPSRMEQQARDTVKREVEKVRTEALSEVDETEDKMVEEVKARLEKMTPQGVAKVFAGAKMRRLLRDAVEWSEDKLAGEGWEHVNFLEEDNEGE